MCFSTCLSNLTVILKSKFFCSFEIFRCHCSPSHPSHFLNPLPPIRLQQLNVAHQEMASMLWKHALVEVLDDFHRHPLCSRNQSPRRHLSVRLSRGKTGQHILGGRLWWRISASIFSLVGVKPPTFSFGCNHGSASTALVLLYWSGGRRIHLSVITSWQLQENTALLFWSTGHASNTTERMWASITFFGE